MRLVQRPRKQPHTRAYKRTEAIMLAQAEQATQKKEEQNNLLREIVQSLRKTLVQIESQLIKLSKASIRTRTQQRQLKESKDRQQEVEQKLKEFKAMLWATRPPLRRQNAGEFVLSD
jgi:small-conductance mechanosensitive channel